MFKAGYGEEIIDNSGGGRDWLLFGEGLDRDSLIFTQDQDDLVISVKESTDNVRVRNWFLGTEWQIDYIQPAGGYGIAAEQIQDLLSTDTPPDGTGPETPPDDGQSGGDDSNETPGGSTGNPLTVPEESSFNQVLRGTASGDQLVGSNGKDLFYSQAGDDTLFGFGGEDWLLAGEGKDYLDGGDGNDVMFAGAGDDQLGGDKGNDTLLGGAGNDIYVYRPDSGHDTIINADGGMDWLIFTGDITENRLSYIRQGDNLAVRIDNGDAGSVTVQDWFKGGEHQLSYIQPSGGSGIAASSISDMAVVESAPESLMSSVAGLGLLSSSADTDLINYYSMNSSFDTLADNGSITSDLTSESNTLGKESRNYLLAG